MERVFVKGLALEIWVPWKPHLLGHPALPESPGWWKISIKQAGQAIRWHPVICQVTKKTLVI